MGGPSVGGRWGHDGWEDNHRRTDPGHFRRKRSLRHAHKSPRSGPRGPAARPAGRHRRWPGGLVNFALGSDTGGSVRIPSSFCGLYGIRPTHGRIPLDGILLQAPSYDTIGWFAANVDTFFRIGQVLLGGEIRPARPQRVVIAEDALEIADPRVVEALSAHIDRLTGLVGNSTRERLSPNGLIDWSGSTADSSGQGGMGNGAGLAGPDESPVEFRGWRPVRRSKSHH